jgi:hypothetical protein
MRACTFASGIELMMMMGTPGVGDYEFPDGRVEGAIAGLEQRDQPEQL